MAFLMPNAHSVCALVVSRDNGDHSLRSSEAVAERGKQTRWNLRRLHEE
jgi:hypothetical protein